MRHPFEAEPDLQITPIEKIRLPLRSRDELPPILAGLQWLWMHPALRAEILGLLETAVLAGKQATGRTGMDLWRILVLGVVRLGLVIQGRAIADRAVHRPVADQAYRDAIHRLFIEIKQVGQTPVGPVKRAFGGEVNHCQGGDVCLD